MIPPSIPDASSITSSKRKPLKGVRNAVKKLRNSLRRVSSISGKRTTASGKDALAGPHSPFVNTERDVRPVPVTISSAHKARMSSDSGSSGANYSDSPSEEAHVDESRHSRDSSFASDVAPELVPLPRGLSDASDAKHEGDEASASASSASLLSTDSEVVEETEATRLDALSPVTEVVSAEIAVASEAPVLPVDLPPPSPHSSVQQGEASIPVLQLPSPTVPMDSPMQSTSPPPAEAEVPDPFLADDDLESEPKHNDEEPLAAGVAEADEPQGLSVKQDDAADEIALAQSTISEAPAPPLATADVNKDVPPTPSAPSHLSVLATPIPAIVASDEEDEEEAPELYLRGLTMPTMFLPIPNTDPLSTLLAKYIPPERRPARDVTGEWQRSDFNTLVMTNSWRALAKMARDRIVNADPEDISTILSLWSLRLQSLARLRLSNQTSAECTNLFTVLNAVEPSSHRQYLFDKLLPFELEVLHVKIKYWTGDHMGYLDALSELLQRCKAKAKAGKRKGDAVAHDLWKERGSRVCLIIASQFIEMKDFPAATKLLEPLCSQSPQLRSAVGRIYVQGGHLIQASKHFAQVAADPTAEPSQIAMNAAILALAEGDWNKGVQALQQLLALDPENHAAVNNYAVALLCQGNVKQGIRLLEEAMNTAPSTVVVAEPLVFNLSTMYELRSTAGADKKRDLLVEVAKWAGDGVRTACLKMPTT